ncbi:alpha/beta hydrolase [Shimia ponticola]|uniref:alpha/beta hydrolase n=1 Tax=Shimia ponticola TaxID=2582893 RepID=UPI0011BF7BCC|nr:alpha/beta hydrolase [Shimia ponticola]
MPYFFFTRRTLGSEGFTHRYSPAVTRYGRINDLDERPRRTQNMKPQEWLRDVLDHADGQDIICFVHGFNTTHTEMLERMRDIENGLRATGGFQGIVIGYSWPSDGETVLALDDPDNKKRLAYNSDKADANKSANHLMPDGLSLFMDALAPNQKLHIIAHSMGARVVTRCFERSTDRWGPTWGISELVFTAADIDSLELEAGGTFAWTVSHRSKRATNYHSGYDDVLDLGKQFVNGGRPRLGRIGSPDLRYEDLNDVDCGPHYRENYRIFADLTQSHRWYFSNQAFFADLAEVIAGQPKGRERRL